MELDNKLMFLSMGIIVVRERINIFKKKVLIVITKADWAGAQRVVYEIGKFISDNNVNIELDVAVGAEGLLCDKLKNKGINVIKLNELKHPINLKQDYKGYKELTKLIKTNKYDVIHAHSTKAGILSRLAGAKCKADKIIYTVHGWWPILQYSGIKRKVAAMVEKYMASKTTSLVFICEKDIEIAKQYRIGKKNQYKTIYNSITVQKPKVDVIREEFNISEKSRIIGNVARVDKQKNPFLFLDIAEEHVNYESDVYYFWVGSGDLEEEINKEITKRKIGNKVKFIGFRENGIDYINGFDVLLMTSEAEGMPITILEALALEKPIVSTEVGGIKEVIGDKNIFHKDDERSEIVKLINNAEYTCCKNVDGMQRDYVDLYLS